MGILLCYAAILVLSSVIVTVFVMKKRAFSPCDWLDRNHTAVIKGVSIVFVVLGHIGNANGVRITAPLGGMGVAAFLICSGFGINQSSKNRFSPIGYWLKRIVNVMLPYFIIRTVVTIISGSFDFVPFVLDITLINPLYPFGWYLQFIMIWYFAFFIAHLIAEKTSVIWKVVILSAVSVACFFLSPTELQAEQSISFLIGVLLSEFYTEVFEAVKKRGVLLIVIPALVGCAAFALKQVLSPEMTYLIYLVQLIYKLFWMLTVIIVVYYALQKFSLALFSWIGAVSYEVYLIHGYMFDWLKTYYGIPLFIICVAAASFVMHFGMNSIKKLVFKNGRFN